MGPAGQRERGRASGACALRACLSGLTVGPGGEARERARGLRSGASGDRWLDWAGAGAAWEQAGARVWAGVGRGWAAREWARCWVDLGRVLAGFWAFWVLGFVSNFYFSPF